MSFTRKQSGQELPIGFGEEFVKTPETLKSKVYSQGETRPRSFSLRHSKSLSLYQQSQKKLNILLIPDYTHKKALYSLIDEENMSKKKNSQQKYEANNLEVYHNYLKYSTNKSEQQILSLLLNQKSLINKYLWKKNPGSGQNRAEGIRSPKGKHKYEVKYSIQFQQSKGQEQKVPQQRLSSIIQDDLQKKSTNSTLNLKNQPNIPYRLAENSGRIKKKNPPRRCYNQNNNQFSGINTDLNSLLHPKSNNLPINQYSNNQKNGKNYNSTNKKSEKDTNFDSGSENYSYSQIIRDLKINIWHAHGLRFRSNVLKFGIQNKDVVIIVHNKIPSLQTQNKQLSEEWRKFIRQTNKKCIIGHLFITEINEKTKKNNEQNKRQNGNAAVEFYSFQQEQISIQQSGINQSLIDIKKISKDEKEMYVNLKVHISKSNNEQSSIQRILKVVDHLIFHQHQQQRNIPSTYSSIIRPRKISQPFPSSTKKINQPWHIPYQFNFIGDIKQTNIHVRFNQNKNHHKHEESFSILSFLREKIFCCGKPKNQQSQPQKISEESKFLNQNQRAHNFFYGSYTMNLRDQHLKKARKKSINSVLNQIDFI